MKTCPECNGVGKFEYDNHVQPCGAFVDEEEDAAFCKAHCEGKVELICGTCEGTGTISDFTFAIYKARGGPAPRIQQRGYA